MSTSDDDRRDDGRRDACDDRRDGHARAARAARDDDRGGRRGDLRGDDRADRRSDGPDGVGNRAGGRDDRAERRLADLDEDGALAGDVLAGIDLGAWQPSPVPSGIPDAVILRMREPVAVVAHDLGDAAKARGEVAVSAQTQERGGGWPRWSWWTTGGVLAAAGLIGGIWLADPWGMRGAPSGGGSGRGDVLVEHASHLDLGPTSAELDGGTALEWRRDGTRVVVAQRSGVATWRVGGADTIEIDPGAMGASIEASGASLRVEVRMQINGSDTRVVVASAATAAVVALVSVIIYQGHVKVTSAGQTVNVGAGSAVEVKPGEPPRDVREVGAARTLRSSKDGMLDGAVVSAALRAVDDEIRACLAGQSVAVMVRGKVHADGNIEELEATPSGAPASCVASAVRNARFAPTPEGGRIAVEFPGDPDAPLPQTVAPMQLEKNRIKGNRNIVPDEFEKRAIAPEEKVVTQLKMCIDREGKVSQVRVLKASGYPGYDRKIETEMRAWEYKPFLVDGKPTSVCTAVTFIYKQQ